VVTPPVNDIARGSGLLENSIAAVDASSWGLLLLRGGEAIDLLQRISTNDCAGCVPGTAVQTVLVNEKAKIVDAVVIVNTRGGILMTTSPGQSALVKAWLERFIIMEDITVEDVTDRFACALVLGNPELLHAHFPVTTRLDTTFPTGAGHVHFSYFSHPAVLVIAASAEAMGSEFASQSIPVVSADAFDSYRVRNGIPGAGREIAATVNPLEAGMKRIVCFTKGCYIGQEVIARLETFRKVQKLLCLVRLEPPPKAAISPEIIGEQGIHGYITTIVAGAEGADAGLALAVMRAPAVGARFTADNGAVGAVIERIFE